MELDPVGLCVYHFTSTVERTCSEIHRQIALRGATPERQAEVGRYIGECSLLLARVCSNLCLSDELKRRILCTLLSLMNLRENLERAATSRVLDLRTFETELASIPVVLQEGSRDSR
ncbi:MAG TPA: hypothetical protein VEU62_08865 [Bryobacterales bacterium]|nr:hypothetical protein [Bryobacterales bacterium]